MAKPGRNQPCPCGSGRKTKRCCPTRPGPDPDRLARIYLDAQADHWAPLLADHTDDEIAELTHELALLPTVDLSLHLPLPKLLPPPLERLRERITERDPDAIVTALPDALDVVDTPTNREHLARAVLALHDHDHRIPCELTAAAIIDLADHDQGSALLFSALYHALTITTGDTATPSGLIIASQTPAA